MTDKEFAAEKKRCQGLLSRWSEALGVRARYRMTYDYYTGPIPDHEDAGMTCTADWRYLHATIAINTEKTKGLDDEHLSWIVLHEFFHVFLNEMREPGIDHEERVATELANAIVLLQGEWAKARREK